MAKSEPQLTEVVVSHSAGGNVDILDYGKVKSNWSVFRSERYVFDGWSEKEIAEYIEPKRQALRDHVDSLSDREWNERWDQSYLSRES